MTEKTLINIGVILLAAGLSSRMGKVNKLLIEIEGKPLVRHVAETYLTATDRVTVILGHEAEKIRKALSGLPLTFILNNQYETGQQSSVRKGLEYAGNQFDIVLIALSDQLFLTSNDLLDMITDWQSTNRDKIMVPYCQEQRGNPVLIPKAIISEILSSEKNPVCRRFIDNNPGRVIKHEAKNNHFVIDLDTPEDLKNYYKGTLGSQ